MLASIKKECVYVFVLYYKHTHLRAVQYCH